MMATKIGKLKEELVNEERIETEIRRRYVQEEIILRGLQQHEKEINRAQGKIKDTSYVFAEQANFHNAMEAIEKFSGNNRKSKNHAIKGNFYTGMCYLGTGALCLLVPFIAAHFILENFGSYLKNRFKLRTSQSSSQYQFL